MDSASNKGGKQTTNKKDTRTLKIESGNGSEVITQIKEIFVCILDYVRFETRLST